MVQLHRLFSPIKINNIELRNRIVMLPMGSSLAKLDGSPSDEMIDHYAARARGGVGLVIVEYTMVHHTSKSPRNAAIFNDEHIPGWKKLADEVHEAGGKVFPQLCHMGRQTTSSVTGCQPLAASAIPCPANKEMPRELSVEEIEELVNSFGDAAVRAQEAGCDGVDIHGAHGYLVCNFMSPWSNKRTDSYGGSIGNRTRFAVEVIKNIKEKCGKDFPVCIRISCHEMVKGGLIPEETSVAATILAEAGVDIINVSRGNFGSVRSLIPSYGTPIAPNNEFSWKIKQTLKIPVMLGQRINDPMVAEQMLSEGRADLIGMGRALLADPDLPNKAAAGHFEDIIPCIGCNQRCVGRTDPNHWVSCMTNPATGRDRQMALVPAPKQKKVLVIGGGLAGMETARAAALRGHQVTLCEKTDKLGGQFNLAAVPPLKQEFTKAVVYFTNQIYAAGVKVELGKEVTAETIAAMKPDAVVVATGAVPLIPPGLAGTNKSSVVTAFDLLAGKTIVSNKVVIIGGGLVGCEVAEYVAERGCTDITILEMLDNVALDVKPAGNRDTLLERLKDFDVNVVTSAKVMEILDDGILYEKNGTCESINEVTDVILATGAKSVNDIEERIKDCVTEVYVVGDAKNPRKALEAIEEGALVGRSI